MSLAVFDIGGTAVKYGLWQEGVLEQKGKFPTPSSFTQLEETFAQTIKNFDTEVTGVAISSPGAVNVEKRRIDGISAVSYLHHRPIFAELEDYLKLPVTIENDANCAGICEMIQGAGKQVQQAVFLVIGTGVGGAIFIHNQLYKGAHLFGGEFGLMRNQNGKALSVNGTVRNTALRFSEKFGQNVDGLQLFDLKKAGNTNATQMISEMYDALVESLYNIQVSLDTEMVIIGGGVSARNEFINELHKRLYNNLAKDDIESIMPEIQACQYHNDANLIGAALNFETLKQ
ncbi:ROK family protein [Tetragenococcus halophilus]|uniref:ROK family protein n=1 Tax=Tetragenococcus halophilus TaxID=51669 RepID=UPI001F443D4C|nr:ROK family protein [Tetragenococcus halophilus]MCF1676647.1 ROK family protein [Tetragenococcus halophilus]